MKTSKDLEYLQPVDLAIERLEKQMKSGRRLDRSIQWNDMTEEDAKELKRRGFKIGYIFTHKAFAMPDCEYIQDNPRALDLPY